MKEIIKRIEELEIRLNKENLKIGKLKKILSMVDTKVADLGDDDEIISQLGHCQMWEDDVDWRLREYRRYGIDKEIGIIVDFDCGLSVVVGVFLSRINSDDEINWGDSELYDSGNIEDEIWKREDIIRQMKDLIYEVKESMLYSEDEINDDEIKEMKEFMNEIKNLEKELNDIIEDFPFEDFISL